MKIIIIGGSHAGIACAIRAREEFPTAEITIYEKQKKIGFIAQSIPLYLSGNVNFLKMSSYTTATELEGLNIEVLTQVAILDIDSENKSLLFFDLVDHIEGEVSYDKLVLATGSYPSLPLVKGVFRDKLYVIKKSDDAEKIKKFMNESRSVIIIGGGAVGVELAELMKNAHIKTTLIHPSGYILNRYLDEAVALEVQKSLINREIEIFTDTIVTSIQEETVDLLTKQKKISHVYTQDGRKLMADGVIYATGFRPSTFLVADKVTLGDKGAIVVDEYMQTSQPDIFAIGDCATTRLTNVKKPQYIPHVSDAIRQGEIAAVNLVAPKIKLNQSQGTYKLNFADNIVLCMTGLTLKKARLEGFDCEMVFIHDQYVNSDEYYELWLVYEKESRRILGMQSRGTAPEIAAQADIISLAIQNQMTVDEIEYTDFYYKHGFKNPRSFTKIIADEIRHQANQHSSKGG
ncbi:MULTISPECIES: FAD-dependent oxidoreductase [unclassified Enterococcus]|uniref:FAD-dependent oxidoreductase n=1 Tax=unclassified Enterococcus TaxID=2608891 RepID=UPI0015558627|nr:MULTISPECIES: FAD-dependent oxidoreductase [unclassified Enterococcus]MBS7576623.1 FAD-dependent oxidoreductase [Enterococcus sp. MMGLQ5-2]MBS7583890.1 FAD-dependent oxidoreductase [Enterococcus sp. MMGLQ5-1]NPD11751.1 FAD-dependent oxidoreductase [Enterococcus sp. MMGLQ5-1]NPD36460.1 FAD-dependent oxidoreductase [Enterococcus sp. MMGLQ5-2]